MANFLAITVKLVVIFALPKQTRNKMLRFKIDHPPGELLSVA